MWKCASEIYGMKSTLKMIALDFKYFGLTLPDLFSPFGKLLTILKFFCQLLVVVIVRGFLWSKVSFMFYFVIQAHLDGLSFIRSCLFGKSTLHRNNNI